MVNSGAWIDCDSESSGALMSLLTIARGGVSIAQMSSMSVIVRIRLERSFCDWLKDPSTVQAAAGRRNFKKVVIDETLFGRIYCCILGGI